MKNLLRSFVIACSVVLLAGGAPAQLIVGNDQAGSASIYYIDVVTGAATAIYTSSGNEAKPWGMAYDQATNTLYWNNGGTLFSSPFSMSLTPTNLGSLTFNGASTNFVGLSFANGLLYGTRNIATEAVYSINPMTLAATQLFVYPAAFDFGGLEHDAATGILYGLSDANTPGLYEINLAAQTTTFRAPYPAGETDIDGLAVFNGRAYYVTDGPNSAQANFYVYDISSGTQVGTLPSPFTGSGTFSAATFISIPEPSSLLLAMFGVAGFAGAGWRKARRPRAS
jgi:PEP-CTERM motif